MFQDVDKIVFARVTPRNRLTFRAIEPDLRAAITQRADAGRPMATNDRRYTYRLDLPEDRVRVSQPSSGRLVVADLSASGSGLIVSPEDFGAMTAEPATFEFEGGRSFSVRLDPVRVSKREGHLRVGARFQGLPVAGMRVLSEFLIREFLEEKRTLGRLLDDPRTLTSSSATFIRRHLRRCLIDERRPLRIYAHGSVLPFSISAERIVEMNGQYLVQARTREIGWTEGILYTFLVALPGSVTHFAAQIEHRQGDTLFIPLPSEIHQAGFRDSIRTPVEAERATMSFTHPRLPDELISRPVLDLSARGFAFESDPEYDLLFPGDRLTGFQIRFPDTVFEATGVIRSVAPHRSSDLYSCGVEIVEFADAGQERLWRERVFRHVHPRAVVVEPKAAASQAWRVLDESGYVRLWAASEDRERLRDEYTRTWGDAGRDVGRLMLVENRGETVGTLAGSLLYPKTWLVHQLGVTERERAGFASFLNLAYELYAGLMYLFQHEASAEYFVIFAERDKRWTQTLYGDFVAQYPDRTAFAYEDNRVFRRDPAAPVSRIVPRCEAVGVVAADAEDLRLVSRALQASCSPVVCDSMAYGPDEIGLESFAETCREVGWERERRVFIARVGGVPVAAVIAESGGEGVNIFGLMNRCFIVNLRSEPVTQAAKAALLEQTAQYFLQLEKPVFLFFDDGDSDIASVELMGFEFVSDGMRFIAGKQVVPAWLNYLKNVLSLKGAEVRRSG
jgi:hypothetical protein